MLLIFDIVGWINQFLSWNGFVPLSRLTYCAYLIHIPILQMLSGGKRHGKYYNDVELVSIIIIINLYYYIYYHSVILKFPYRNTEKLLSPMFNCFCDGL